MQQLEELLNFPEICTKIQYEVESDFFFFFQCGNKLSMDLFLFNHMASKLFIQKYTVHLKRIL